MIQPNDLKKGNWVSDKHASEKGMWQVNEIRKLTCKYGQFMSKYEDLRPIPLTAEVLEKAGFKTMERRGESYFINYWLPNKYAIAYCEKSTWIHEEGKYYCGKTEVELKSLHQLQNLYHSLTNKELEFTP